MSRQPGLRLSLQTVLLLSFASLLPAAARGEEREKLAPWIPESTLVSAKLSEQGHLLIVPVKIDGKVRQMMINTDAPTTLFDREWTGHLKPVDVTKFAEQLQAAGIPADTFCHPPTMEIGKYRVPALAAILRTNKGANVSDLPFAIHGALGMDILKDLVLHIDLENDVVSLCTASADIRPPGKAAHIFLGQDKAPFVTIEFASGVSEPFKIDTSLYSSSGKISRSVLNQLGLLDGLTLLRQTPRIKDNGEPDTDEFYKASAALAGVTAKNLTFALGDANLLSVNYLLRQRVTIDFKNERLYSQPTRFTTVRDRYNHDGFRLGVDDQQITFEYIEPDSIAEKAGLRAGDKLLAVNNIPTKLRGLANRELQVPSDQPLKLEIEREGKQLNLELPGEP